VLRFCLPRVYPQGRRLDAELIPRARAFLAAQVLGARLLPPAAGSGRSARRFATGIGPSFADAPSGGLCRRALQRLLPVLEFTEGDFLAHGGGSAEGALERFAAEHGLRRRHGFVLATGGTWGGYAHVRTAREFLRSLLYQSRDTARHLLQLRSRIDAGKLLVGVIPPPAAPHAGYGAVGPPAGLDAALAGLRAAVGQGWQLLLAGGAALPQSLPRAGLACIDTAALPRSECSDVLALAQCDLLLRPASQSDELEAFLSDAPCVCLETGPGTEAGTVLPAAALEQALRRRDARGWEWDLVRGGIAPQPPAAPAP
jgi:hypothetical protein